MTKRRQRANLTQRKRRAEQPRIDYYPSLEALAVIETRRTRYHPTNNYSGILDTILREWAALVGINPITRTSSPPVMEPELSDQYARARITSVACMKSAPELRTVTRTRAHARMTSGSEMSEEHARALCGARRRRDGLPCQSRAVAGKSRCKWHGGASTGPKTEAGRARAKANLRQYRS